VGTGLIYAAIVAAWAAYLVPLWLRRHDEAAASRSVDRFSEAMRVLERRRSAYLRPGAEPVEPNVYQPSYPSPATRRRRTLVVLLAVTTGVTVLVVLDVIETWTIAVPSAVVVVFLMASIRAGRRERETARRRWERLRARAAELAEMERAAAEAEAEAAVQPVVAVLPEEDYPRRRDDDENRWTPRDVPLPTYLEKERAPRVRTVEIGRVDETGEPARSEDQTDEDRHEQAERPAAGE